VRWAAAVGVTAALGEDARVDADDPHDAVVDQTLADAVRALLSHPDDQAAGAVEVRHLLRWLALEHGPAAVLHLAEAAIGDLAEAMTVIARGESREPLVVHDEWNHDVPLPAVAMGGDGDSGQTSPRGGS